MMSIFVFAVIASFSCQTIGSNSNCVELGYYSNLDLITQPNSYVVDRKENLLLEKVGIDSPETPAPNNHRFHTDADKYYLYSVTPDSGEVNGITQVRNDISSLIFMTQQAEKEWPSFSEGNRSAANDILAFYRSFNKNYYPNSGGGYINGLGWFFASALLSRKSRFLSRTPNKVS